MRLFAGFSLSAEARAEAARAVRSMGLDGVSHVPVENLHVTAAFLGEREDAADVEAALSAAAAASGPARPRLGAPGGFPSAARARVLWIGLSDPAGALAACAGAARAALRDAIGWAGGEDFKAHVTVARARRRPVAVPPVGVEPIPFDVTSLDLFESVLRGGRAPLYRVVASFPLSGPAASAQPGGTA